MVMYSWVCASMPGGDPQQHWYWAGQLQFLVQCLQQFQLVEVVYHYAAHSGQQRLAQLIRRLVVAVQENALGVEPVGQGNVQLAAGGNV